ncbi:MAG: DUF4298 domain-containing protein [Erysipelotrichaceae bacterium]|nr:DUF4298 domain-containing protein [Erysipelotrichaceae bacterium]MBQ1534527.1 DUF4298 domain-containing protein [Erysipelotrichaceae bacterium]MBQ1787538.1 DUF4298 domain-containing protein [Erysipelotrichaceae bacterium]MBQ5805516.1 DUF4298 domain-containing protein [Erysipelotrichaceae bacterium]
MNAQIKRIQEMEKLLNECRKVLDDCDKALSDFRSIQQKIGKLEAYYTGRKWIKDYEDYEAGKIPKDLPCGVLSEDAVYDLLTENRDLILEMLELAKDRIR